MESRDCGGVLDFSPDGIHCLSCWEAIADGDYRPDVEEDDPRIPWEIEYADTAWQMEHPVED